MPTVKISGMSCGHCTAAVSKALSSIAGVSEVAVDLEKGEASYNETMAVSPDTIKKAIAKIGFEVIDGPGKVT